MSASFFSVHPATHLQSFMHGTVLRPEYGESYKVCHNSEGQNISHTLTEHFDKNIKQIYIYIYFFTFVPWILILSKFYLFHQLMHWWVVFKKQSTVEQCNILIYLLTYLHTTYLLTYLHTYLLTYLHTYLLIYFLIYLHTYLLTHTYKLTYLLTYIHTYLRTCILTYILT